MREQSRALGESGCLQQWGKGTNALQNAATRRHISWVSTWRRTTEHGTFMPTSGTVRQNRAVVPLPQPPIVSVSYLKSLSLSLSLSLSVHHMFADLLGDVKAIEGYVQEKRISARV